MMNGMQDLMGVKPFKVKEMCNSFICVPVTTWLNYE
jgi:hypothetical protein